MNYISILVTVEKIEASLTTESNDLLAKVTLPTYLRSSLLNNLMLTFLFNQHLFSAYRFILIFLKTLKVQSCKLCNNKYIIALAQTTNIETFAFIAPLVFKLLRRKLAYKQLRQQKLLKSGVLCKKQQISRINYCKIRNGLNAKFPG